jgi:hypothetical protein
MGSSFSSGYFSKLSQPAGREGKEDTAMIATGTM